MNYIQSSLDSQMVLTFGSILFFGFLLLMEQASREKKREEIEAIKACNVHRKSESIFKNYRD